MKLRNIHDLIFSLVGKAFADSNLSINVSALDGEDNTSSGHVHQTTQWKTEVPPPEPVGQVIKHSTDDQAWAMAYHSFRCCGFKPFAHAQVPP